MSAKSIIGICEDRQDFISFAIVVFGSPLSLPPSPQDKICGAAECDVEHEHEAQDEGEGAEEDGAVVGVQVGEEERGGEGVGRGGGEEATERTVPSFLLNLLIF